MDIETVRLYGRSAIVTGGATGMGLATAQLFARQGARVAVADIDFAAAEAAADAIAQAGGDAFAFQADVSQEAEVAALVQATVDRYGRVDCAVNNAAIKPDMKPIHEADMDEFDRVVAINLRGVMLCMKHEIAQMRRQGGKAAIVNIGSVGSQRPQPHSAAYTAAKHAVIGLTKVGSLENAPLGIRINAVLPGAIATPMIEAALRESNISEAAAASQLSLFGRLGQPIEVAHASLWLCSDAASFVTGHSLAVDAGYLSR